MTAPTRRPEAPPLLAEPEIRAIPKRLRAGDVSATEAVRAVLDHLAARDPAIGAYLHVDGDGALARARELDRVPAAERGSLHGLPVAIKDNIAARGLPSTSGSALLDRYVSPYDATAVARLREAGAVILGTTNLDEFGMGSTTRTGRRHPSRNPWDPSRSPGGSSGGSAAAVAAGCACGALGTDTGGSVQLPASHCGIVGIRPTWSRVSRYGVTAYASSLDQIGCLAFDIDGAARLLGAIAGADRRDATSSTVPVPDFPAAAARPALPERMLALEEGELESLPPGTAAAYEDALERLRYAGCRIARTPLPDPDRATAAYYLIACAEASSNLARFDGIRYGRRAEVGASGTLDDVFRRSRAEGFGAEVRARVILGRTVLSEGYRDALYEAATRERRRLASNLGGRLEDGSLFCLPAATAPPQPVSRPVVPIREYRADRFTVLPALASLPALSVPAGAADGLPFGVSFVGPKWAEDRLFSAGEAFLRRSA